MSAIAYILEISVKILRVRKYINPSDNNKISEQTMNINYKHHAIIRDNTKHISRSVSELDESFSSGVIDSIIRNQTYESMYHLWVYMTKDNGTIINRLTGVMWNLLMSIYPELWTDYFIFEYQRNNS